MNIAQAVFTSLLVDDPVNWGADWVWGLPLIVLTVVIHVIGLGLINQRVDRVTGGTIVRHHPTSAFVLVMGVTTLLATHDARNRGGDLGRCLSAARRYA